MTADANVELEIKLALEPSALAKARSILVSQAEASDAGSMTLRNIYFDTQEFALNRQRMALRVRQKGQRFIQTLKTQGEFVDGGHRRLEWEWPVSSDALDPALLAETPLADQTNPHLLKPVFETNFERQVVMVRQQGPREETQVEVAIDEGRILSGGVARSLSEIEFELKSGDPEVLRHLATRLAASVPVFLNLVSKAEQGYHLAGIPSPEPSLGSTPDVYEFLRCLSACWLHGASFPSVKNPAKLRLAARSAGVSDDFEKVLEQLANGTVLSQLIADGILGRTQLALAGFSAA